jgi:hypothetical protein
MRSQAKGGRRSRNALVCGQEKRPALPRGGSHPENAAGSVGKYYPLINYYRITNIELGVMKIQTARTLVRAGTTQSWQ